MTGTGASILDYYEAFELALSGLSSVRGEYRRHFGCPTSSAPAGYCWFKGVIAPERHPDYADWLIPTGTELEARLLADLPRLAPTSLLDIGCGNGALLRRLADRHIAATLTGINFHPMQVRTARWLLDGTRAEVIEADFMQHAFGRRFELAYLFESAFHILDKPQLCRRIAEVLLPRGEVWLLDIVIAERAASTFQILGRDQSPFNYVPRAEWQRCFGESGLKETEFVDLSRPVAEFLQVSDIGILREEYFRPRLTLALRESSPPERHQADVERALELMVRIATEYKRLSRLLRGGMLQYVLMRYRFAASCGD